MKGLPCLLLVLGLLVASCDNSTTQPRDDYAYYPLEVGSYLVYDVRQETYSAGKQEPTVTVWQEKDQVIDRINNEDNNTSSFIIARFTRTKTTDYWTKAKEFRVTRAPDKILTSLDNETFFDLIFPVDRSARWNGNAYNTRDEEQYTYDAINEPFGEFENTLTVVERMDSSRINKYVGIKKYALNVGLVYDDQISYEYCQTDECLASDVRKIESGVHKSRMVAEYGKGE